MQNDSMMKKLQIMICILGLLGLNSCSDYLNKESSDEVIVKTVSDYSELLLGAGYPEPTGSLYNTLYLLDDDYMLNESSLDDEEDYSGAVSAFPFYTWQANMWERQEVDVSTYDESYSPTYTRLMGVNAVLYYGPTIFENVGLSGGDSLFYQVLIGAVNMGTTVLALLIIDKIGRKKLVYYGVSGMIVSLLLIAFYFSFGESLGLSSILMLIFFLLYVFCTAVSISAVVWVLLSEMYPTKVRGIAMSIAGFALWVGTYLVSQLTPWLLGTITPAGTFLLFAVMCVPYMLIMWRYIPETAGKSLEEIEKYWLSRK